MTWPAFLLTLALALPSTTSAAALYKCATANGVVAFQQAPCADGSGAQLEAGEAFGVRPPSSRQRVTAPPNGAASSDNRPNPAVVDHTPDGQPIYAGPRGGRYTLTVSGRKNYLPKSTGGSDTTSATPSQQAGTPAKIHVGPRGGCFTVGPTGRKNYLPADRCPRD